MQDVGAVVAVRGGDLGVVSVAAVVAAVVREKV